MQIINLSGKITISRNIICTYSNIIPDRSLYASKRNVSSAVEARMNKIARTEKGKSYGKEKRPVLQVADER